MRRICFVEEFDATKERRKARKKEKFNNTLNNIKNFYYNHRIEVVVFGPVILAILGKTLKFTGKQINNRSQKQIKNLYCYDRSLGHYWKLRRELTNDEWIVIDKRKQNGERLADILNELKVLR